MRKTLLIGNGPSATSMKLGKEIDEFEGVVVRFNAYDIKGFEEYVGTRTDEWVTCSTHPRWWKDYDKVWLVNYARKRDDFILKHLRKRYPDCEDIPEWAWDYVQTITPMIAPSSGAVVAAYYQRDSEVYIYGFDFFLAKRHHYGNDEAYCYHNATEEQRYFGKLLRLGKVKPFHDYLRKLNYHIFEAGIKVEREKYEWIYAGGDDDYGHRNHGRNTYPLIEKLHPNTLLDVGCGKGEFVEWCNKRGIKAVGLDFASGYGIPGDVLNMPFPDKSFDVVTAFDVLEHLKPEELAVALAELKRVTNGPIIVSVGYGPSRIKTPDSWVELHPINDKDEEQWMDALSLIGVVEKWGIDYYGRPFFVIK